MIKVTDTTAFTTLEPGTELLTGCVSGSVSDSNADVNTSSGVDLDVVSGAGSDVVSMTGVASSSASSAMGVTFGSVGPVTGVASGSVGPATSVTFGSVGPTTGVISACGSGTGVRRGAGTGTGLVPVTGLDMGSDLGSISGVAQDLISCVALGSTSGVSVGLDFIVDWFVPVHGFGLCYNADSEQKLSSGGSARVQAAVSSTGGQAPWSL